MFCQRFPLHHVNWWSVSPGEFADGFARHTRSIIRPAQANCNVKTNPLPCFSLVLSIILEFGPSERIALSDQFLLEKLIGGIKMTTHSTILVVDDYADNRTLLSAWLRAKGYQVVEAKDGREGLLQANRSHPDLILMDLAMPEVDGVEATRQIRERRTLARTPIFAIS